MGWKELTVVAQLPQMGRKETGAIIVAIAGPFEWEGMLAKRPCEWAGRNCCGIVASNG